MGLGFVDQINAALAGKPPPPKEDPGAKPTPGYTNTSDPTTKIKPAVDEAVKKNSDTGGGLTPQKSKAKPKKYDSSEITPKSTDVKKKSKIQTLYNKTPSLRLREED